MSTQSRSKSRSRAASRTRPHAPRPARRAAKSPARRRAAHRARSGARHGAAAHELELFVALLKKCKRAVGSFSDEQKQHLRAVMAKAHRAIDKLHS